MIAVTSYSGPPEVPPPECAACTLTIAAAIANTLINPCPSVFICGYLLSPVYEKNEQINRSNDTITVEIGRAIRTILALPPIGE
jgi:hypothetical protein